MELALEVKCISTFTELHVHANERWPTEVTSNTYFRGVNEDIYFPSYCVEFWSQSSGFSPQALPYVTMLILLMLFMYSVIGMQVR